jgi:ferredoxin/coenzyme F420-reducing hydrogenase delta subunit
MLYKLRHAGRRAFARFDSLLERGFGTRLNPLLHLGAMTIFFCWVVLVSGIWLLIFFRTSVDGAYQSVEYLTHEQWYLGGVMRSLHRYASDAAIVTLLLHMIKEWVIDHYRAKRWFSWITGVPLLWLLIPLGITGYWLVWDRLAQYVALTSAELLDAVPIFTDSMARNFLSAEALSDRFFTLMAFMHLIGLPLFLVFAIWLHVFRISGPRINPPRKLMVGTLLVLVLLSLVYPALSQGKADLAMAPQSLALDWYYLLVYPLMKSWPPAAVWSLLLGFSLLLLLAPWLPPARSPAVAVVDLENCNGCARCVDDCPYGAVMMRPRTDGTAYDQEAVVDAALCVSCGICVGACPTAMPFRKATTLSPGIDLPDLSAATLRAQIEAAGARLRGQQRVIAFACAGSTAGQGLEDHATAVVTLRCMAQLPPSFVDFILSRNLADGVYLAGCTGGDCAYRIGAEWTRLRMHRDRDPRLRRRIDSKRLALAWDDAWKTFGRPANTLQAFRDRLAALAPGSAAAEPPKPQRGERWRRRGVRAVAYGLFAVAASTFSAWPVFELFGGNQAVISLTITHAGQRVEQCRRLSQQELERLPPNMRKPADCPRQRHPVAILFQVDGRTLYQTLEQPSGIWKDGESTVYARLPVDAGEHRLFIGMSDSGDAQKFDYQQAAVLKLVPQQNVVVEFDGEKQLFVFR